MTTHNPKFRGTPGPWRVDGHVGGNGVANYSIVSISGDAVGCAPVAEVLRNNPRPMPEQRIEANARLLAAACKEGCDKMRAIGCGSCALFADEDDEGQGWCELHQESVCYADKCANRISKV